MTFLRRMGLVLLTPFLFLFLFATAFDLGIIRSVSHADNVKHILADTGIYKTIVPDMLAQAKTVSTGQTQISLDQTVVLNAAGKAFTPQIIQSSAENAIDGIYHWLDGKVSQPDFRIDLSQVKINFADAVAQAAKEQAAKLPACTTYTLSLPANFDPFSATCLPMGVTPEQVATIAKNTVTSGQGFLDNPVITANTLKDSNGQLIFSQKLKDVPGKYQKIKETPWLLALLSVLVAAAIFFLSKGRRAGLRHVGVIVLIAGLFVLAFSWALNYGVNQKALPSLKLENNAVLEKDVKLLAKDITQNIDKNYWYIGAVYATLGAAAIATSIFWRRQRTAAAGHHHEEQPPAEAAESEPKRPAKK